MKNIFKKGLVVLLASLFVTSVFAAQATTTTTTATTATTAAAKHVVVTKRHCKKHCHMNKAGHKVCHTHCKKVMHHHVMPVKKADTMTTTTKTETAK